MLQKRNPGHPTDLADLFGIRFAACSEIGEGLVLDEALTKRLTGGDTIRARRMREDFWEFSPTHHLWVAANHRPIIRGTDHAIWRRILIVPFEVIIPTPTADLSFGVKLRGEREGILAWMVEGCRLWLQEERLRPPPQVQLRVDDYRKEMDIIGEFITELCSLSSLASVQASMLYREFRRWCEDHGEPQISQKAFTAAMDARGFPSKRGARGLQAYQGLRLRSASGRIVEDPLDESYGARAWSG